ncbi:hypothetical protein [Ruegeria hyattellae]|uniref:hypothetical protein n=1 Tax=Ruegeria hyattellae TaxID=3233337 RepID=UPI00355BC505
MDMIKTTEYARALYTAQGPKAEAEIARKIQDCKDKGQEAEAQDWKAVRRAIISMRGPHQG